MQIRVMIPEDLVPVTELCAELGYQVTTAQTAERLRHVAASEEAAALVASEHGIITGWIHAHVNRTLTSDARAEIVGLVVSRNARRTGVGRALVNEVERWATARGLRTVRVRCAVTRSEAHQFYRALGYEASKRQEVFDKALL